MGLMSKTVRPFIRRVSRAAGKSYWTGMVFAKSPAGVYSRMVGKPRKKLVPAQVQKIVKFGELYDNERIIGLARSWASTEPLLRTRVQREIEQEVMAMQLRYNAGRLTTGVGAAGSGVAVTTRQRRE